MLKDNFLSLLFAVYFTTVRVSQAQNQCSGATFDRKQNTQLVCGVFQNFSANAVLCQEKCSSTLKCFSVNAYKKTNGEDVCEFVNGTTRSFGGEDSSCLVNRENSEHFELTEIILPKCPNSNSCPQKIPQRAASPDGWYQFGSSVFKLFHTEKTWEGARDACVVAGATLASIGNEMENKFVGEVLLSTLKVRKIEETQLNAEKHWKLGESAADLTLYGDASYDKESSVVNLPGLAGSYATTSSFPISNVSFTIALWFKLENCEGKTCYIYSYWGNPFLFHIKSYTPTNASACLSFRARSKTDQSSYLMTVVGNEIVRDEKWTHLAVTWNRTEKRLRLYQDGVKVGAQTVQEEDVDLQAPLRNVFDIGFKRDTDVVTKGQVRDIVVFGRELTEEEVTLVRDTTGEERIGAWIGPPTSSYGNMVPLVRDVTLNCSFIEGRKYLWDKYHCLDENVFVCKKTI